MAAENKTIRGYSRVARASGAKISSLPFLSHPSLCSCSCLFAPPATTTTTHTTSSSLPVDRWSQRTTSMSGTLSSNTRGAGEAIPAAASESGSMSLGEALRRVWDALPQDAKDEFVRRDEEQEADYARKAQDRREGEVRSLSIHFPPPPPFAARRLTSHFVP